MPGKFLMNENSCVFSQDALGEALCLLLFCQDPSPDTMLQNAFTESLKSSLPLFRICSCYPYTANIHFYAHKEDITNFKKGHVN